MIWGPTMKVFSQLYWSQFAVVNCQTLNLPPPAVIDRGVGKNKAPCKLPTCNARVWGGSGQNTIQVTLGFVLIGSEGYKHRFAGLESMGYLEPGLCDITRLIDQVAVNDHRGAELPQQKWRPRVWRTVKSENDSATVRGRRHQPDLQAGSRVIGWTSTAEFTRTHGRTMPVEPQSVVIFQPADFVVRNVEGPESRDQDTGEHEDTQNRTRRRASAIRIHGFRVVRGSVSSARLYPGAQVSSRGTQFVNESAINYFCEG